MSSSSNSDSENYLDINTSDYDNDNLCENDVETYNNIDKGYLKYSFKIEETKNKLKSVRGLYHLPLLAEVLINYQFLSKEIYGSEYMISSELNDEINMINNLIVSIIRTILTEFKKKVVVILDNFIEKNIVRLVSITDQLKERIDKVLNKYNEIFDCINLVEIFDTVQSKYIYITDFPNISMILLKNKADISYTVLQLCDKILTLKMSETDKYVGEYVNNYNSFLTGNNRILAIQKIQIFVKLTIEDLIKYNYVFEDDKFVGLVMVKCNEEIQEKVQIIMDIMEYHNRVEMI